MTISLPIEVFSYSAVFLIGAIVVVRFLWPLLMYRGGGYYPPPMTSPRTSAESRTSGSVFFFLTPLVLIVMLTGLNKCESAQSAPSAIIEQPPDTLYESLPKEEKQKESEKQEEPIIIEPTETSPPVSRVVGLSHFSKTKKVSKVLKKWSVQINSFDSKENAINFANELMELGLSELGIIFIDDSYKVTSGRFITKREAIKYKGALKARFGIKGYQVKFDF